MALDTTAIGQINIETVIIVMIVLVTLNLLFIGFYIVSVLRELRKTITKAREMIDDVDRGVKDGIDKVVSIERPLQAITNTANALAGFLKGADTIKKSAQSIIDVTGLGSFTKSDDKVADNVVADDMDIDSSMDASDVTDGISSNLQTSTIVDSKTDKKEKKPRLFKRSK